MQLVGGGEVGRAGGRQAVQQDGPPFAVRRAALREGRPQVLDSVVERVRLDCETRFARGRQRPYDAAAEIAVRLTGIRPTAPAPCASTKMDFVCSGSMISTETEPDEEETKTVSVTFLLMVDASLTQFVRVEARLLE